MAMFTFDDYNYKNKIFTRVAIKYRTYSARDKIVFKSPLYSYIPEEVSLFRHGDRENKSITGTI